MMMEESPKSNEKFRGRYFKFVAWAATKAEVTFVRAHPRLFPPLSNFTVALSLSNLSFYALYLCSRSCPFLIYLLPVCF